MIENSEEFGSLSISENMQIFLFGRTINRVVCHLDYRFRLKPVLIVLYLKLLPYYLEFATIFNILEEFSQEVFGHPYFYRERGDIKRVLEDNSMDQVELPDQDLTVWKECIELMGTIVSHPMEFCCGPQISVFISNEKYDSPLLKYKRKVGLYKDNMSILVLLNWILYLKDLKVYYYYKDRNLYETYVQDSNVAVWEGLWALFTEFQSRREDWMFEKGKIKEKVMEH